jgi:hypothetical protein
MTTHFLKTNQLSEEAFAWLQDKYRAVDSRDHDGYARFLADNCSLQFANNPIVHGEEALLAGIDNFWQSIHGLNHNFMNVLGTEDQMVLEANIDYTRADDRVVVIPCVTIIERNNEGLAESIRIFLDVTPLF